MASFFECKVWPSCDDSNQSRKNKKFPLASIGSGNWTKQPKNLIRSKLNSRLTFTLTYVGTRKANTSNFLKILLLLISSIQCVRKLKSCIFHCCYCERLEFANFEITILVVLSFRRVLYGTLIFVSSRTKGKKPQTV